MPDFIMFSIGVQELYYSRNEFKSPTRAKSFPRKLEPWRCGFWKQRTWAPCSGSTSLHPWLTRSCAVSHLGDDRSFAWSLRPRSWFCEPAVADGLLVSALGLGVCRNERSRRRWSGGVLNCNGWFPRPKSTPLSQLARHAAMTVYGCLALVLAAVMTRPGRQSCGRPRSGVCWSASAGCTCVSIT